MQVEFRHLCQQSTQSQAFLPATHSCSSAAIPVAWTFMSEIFANNVALSSGCQGTIIFASTVFYGHATDMNVHPAFNRPVIAHKT
jgi:hypothetical protein